jgi:signal transduction histidine kinase
MTRLIHKIWLRMGASFLVPLLFSWLGPTASQAESGGWIEGTVDSVRPISGGGLELKLACGTNSCPVDIVNASGESPALFSRIRAEGGSQVNAEQGVPTTIFAGMDQIQCVTGSVLPLAENATELRQLGFGRQHVQCVARLQGLVLGVSPSRETLALQDATGVALVKMKTGGRLLAPGREVILEGNGIVEGDRLVFHSLPVVENNGIHTMIERSGTIYLTAGKHPFQLLWFNWVVPYGLEVYYQGPGLERQRVPDSAFSHEETNADGSVRWVQGLDYRCYEGTWLQVPDFDSLIPVKQGSVANCDPSMIPRPEDVGLQFTGYVDVPGDGIYSFSTISDDGSLLYVDEESPSVEVIGTNALPDPVPITVGQTLRADQDDRWSEAEGVVTFVGERAGGLQLELSSDTGRMRIEVADSLHGASQLLLNSRIRATGICLGAMTTDGENVAGKLVAPGMDQIELEEVPAERWNSHPEIPIAELAAIKIRTNAEIIHIEGLIGSRPDRGLFIQDETGWVPLEMAPSPARYGTGPVEMLGYWSRAKTNFVFRCAICRNVTNEPLDKSAALPTLNTVGQIKRLNRDKWQLGYPVKIRGVITAMLDSGFFIQDSSGSIYARWHPPTESDTPRVGDYWEIEGTTFAEFAPNIQVNSATCIGSGTLPQPLRPTWDQLINGSLDTEYVEVQGIVTAIEPDGLTLLTSAGEITIELPDVQPQLLNHYENARIRIRGCIFPLRDVHTQQVEVGQIRMLNTSIDVDEPAPANLFSAPLEHASDLLLFDPAAGALERVRIGGQIVQARNGEYFLMDGQDGLRFIPKTNAVLSVGDIVQVVGFPELGGPSPVLREAVAEVLSKARLPDARALPEDDLFNRQYDSTLVSVKAQVTGTDRDGSDQILQLKAGTWDFVARLSTKDGLLPDLAQGSLVSVAGVYDAQGGDLVSGRKIDAFDLLMNSRADLTVLAQPSWWTLRHTLTVIGAMALSIIAATVWITLLRRQVEERSAQLVEEVRRRENSERQRELEQERARIARDLHDDLGSELTAISMLATPGRKIEPNTAAGRLREIADKSRSLVSALDGVVWVTNPRNDTLSSLVEYVASYAEEFLAKAGAACRIEMPAFDGGRKIAAEVRHDVLLAVREALNNAVRHGHPTEVLIQFIVFEDNLEILIKDNGRGFETENGSQGNGMLNLHERMRHLGGRCVIRSSPNEGTSVTLALSLRNQEN